MTGMLAGQASAKEIIADWRHKVDAAAAGDARISVGVRATDSAEEVTLRLRNSVLNTFDGVADRVDAVVELSLAQLADNPAEAETVSGDPGAFGRLLGMLDLEVGGFYMHMR